MLVRRWTDSRPHRGVGRLFITYRRQGQGIADSVAWAIALLFATLLRYDFNLNGEEWRPLLIVVPLAVAMQTIVGVISGLYSGRWRFGSFDEVAALVRAISITTVLIFLVNAAIGARRLPLSVPLTAGFTALVLTAGTRYAWRLALDRTRRHGDEGCQRLLIFGAGEGAEGVIRSLLRDTSTNYEPVAMLDDDPAKRRLSIMGVKVVGGRSEMLATAEAYRVDALLIAIPSAGATLVAELAELAAQVGLRTMVLPSLRELLDGKVDGICIAGRSRGE